MEWLPEYHVIGILRFIEPVTPRERETWINIYSIELGVLSKSNLHMVEPYMHNRLIWVFDQSKREPAFK